MFRFAIPGALVLAFTSTATVAGEHYIEIWNPPEARLTQPLKPAANGKSGNGKAQLAMRHTPKAAPRRVADPVVRAVPGKRAADTIKAPVVAPRASGIPRIITPEGNVLRVNDRGAAVEVLH